METKCTARSLAEYEIIALRNKVNKMQTQINKLTSENTSLKSKVTTLETLIAHLYAQLNIYRILKYTQHGPIKVKCI